MFRSHAKKYNRILGILLLALCLTVTVTGTFAWFTKRFYLKADNEMIQLDYGGVSISDMHVYKYIQSTGEIIDLSVNEDGSRVVITEDGYELTPYDSIFIERNINTPLVFEMELICDDLEHLQLDCVCTSTAVKEDIEGKRHTSNIMRIGAATAGKIGLTQAGLTKEQKFRAVADYFNEDAGEGRTSTKAFLSAEEAVNPGPSDPKYIFGEKKTEISCTVFKAPGETTVDDKITVYYVIDYSKLLVEAQEVNQFSQIGIMQQFVPFYDDIKFTGFSIAAE